MLARWRLPGAL